MPAEHSLRSFLKSRLKEKGVAVKGRTPGDDGEELLRLSVNGRDVWLKTVHTDFLLVRPHTGHGTPADRLVVIPLHSVTSIDLD